MSNPIAGPNLAAELWTSLRALAASHAAMHSVAYPHDAWIVLSSDGSALAIASTQILLEWNATSASSGIGTWQLIPASSNENVATAQNHRGTYFFTSDGFVCFGESSEILELEAAVEKILSPLQNLERRA